MDLNSKTILVTGASSGIGKALTQDLIKRNCRLVIIARRKELLDRIINESGISDENVLAIKCDVSKKLEVSAAYNLMTEKFGVPDIAILNSAVVDSVQVEEYNSASAENIFAVNFLGVIYWIEKLLPDFRKQDSGIIAAVSSLADARGYSGAGFYTATKAALTNHLEGLALSLITTNVKIVTIRPGFVKTPMIEKFNSTPLAITAEKASKEIIKGLEKEKRYIEFPSLPSLLHKIVKIVPGKIFEKFYTR